MRVKVFFGKHSEHIEEKCNNFLKAENIKPEDVFDWRSDFKMDYHDGAPSFLLVLLLK